MPQGVLPFYYEEEKSDSGLTGLAGLPLYLDLAFRIEMRQSIENHLNIRTQGRRDADMIICLILLNLAGGEAVSDLNILESDNGFCQLLNRIKYHGMKRRDRRELQRRFRKESRRSVPSPSSVFSFLAAFHDPDQEKERDKFANKAFIPKPNAHLMGLRGI